MDPTTNAHTVGLATTVRLSESDRHRLLAAERRRVLLDVLSDPTPPCDLEELAAAVIAREEGTDDPEDEVREQVVVSLYHHHLPMMADLGVLDFDREAGRVESPP